MRLNYLLVVCILLTYFISCTSNEIGNSKDVVQDKIYQSYIISYNEKDQNLSASAVFRFAGPDGTTLVLNKPSRLELDSEVLRVNSNDFRGAYYEVSKTATQWLGKHAWRFTDFNNKMYVNEFSFDPFKWDNPPVSALKSSPLKLNFITTDLGPDDYVEINTIDSDSSFTFTQGSIKSIPFSAEIPVTYLKKQTQPVLKLEAVRVQKIKLVHTSSEGGELLIRYTLTPVEIKLQ